MTFAVSQRFTYERGRNGVENGIQADAHHELLEFVRFRSVLNLHHIANAHQTDQTAEQKDRADGEKGNQRQDDEAAQHRRVAMTDVTDSADRIAVDAFQHEYGDGLKARQQPGKEMVIERVMSDRFG